MDKTLAIVGSALMFLAVAAGAFGAHALRDYFSSHPELESSFETAVRYQMVHALALFAVAWAIGRWPGPMLNWAGFLFIIGIVLFSGSLYILSLSGVRWLGAIAPLGGLAFLGGWALFFIAAWRA